MKNGWVKMEIPDKSRKKKVLKVQRKCEDCEFFEDDGVEVGCTLSLDEDEFADFLMKNTAECPYFRFYDEYKSVQKQN